MARGGGGGRGCAELRGLLLPPKDEGAAGRAEDEASDEEAAPEDLELPDDFLEDFDRPVPRTEVIILDEESQKQYLVAGRLPFVGPWWKVSVKVKPAGSKYRVQGYPSYFLQTDAGENQEYVLSLFFKECGVPDTFREKFFEWYKKYPPGISLNFIHLKETLNTFRESVQESPESNDFNIIPYIGSSLAGQAVLAALYVPQIVEFLPKLLPRNISGCIGWLQWDKINNEDRFDEDKCTKLKKLNNILNEEPWKLGFSKIMYRELHTSFVEVSWTTFCECRLDEKIPDLQKNALIIYAKLKERCRKMGYTYEEQHTLTHLVSEDMSVECAWQSLKFLKDEGIVATEGELVFLYNLYKAEKEIATIVHDLMKKSSLKFHVDPKEALNCGGDTISLKDPVVENKMPDEEFWEMDQEEPSSILNVLGTCNNSFVAQPPKEEMRTEVDPDQECAIELLCASPVTVISGKAGSGKTTVVTSLFRLLKKMETEEIRKACEDFEADLDLSDEWTTCSQNSGSQNVNGNKCRNESLNVLFTAPTGRAAGLLRKKTQQQAYTLSQVIWSYYAQTKRTDEEPWKFSKTNVLVVDEGSLVSVEALGRVLEILSCEARLQKLIILGDVRQLPSIAPGNMLADMFKFLKSRGCALDLRTNHRAESQLIVDNAARISQQRYPIFDAVVRISDKEVGPMPSPEKKFILVALPAEDGGHCLPLAIKGLLERGPGLEDAKLSQFISFRRLDCEIVNELCCMHYSKHPMRNAKNQPHFLCGDKVCATRNAYIKELCLNTSCTKNDENSHDSGPCECNVCERRRARASANEPEEKNDNYDDGRLCNGEIFFIKEDKIVEKRRILTIRLPEGEEYTMSYEALLKISKIKHAWARTIHTFQGSEEDTIVYVVGNSGLQNWQHVYTAVTRGCSRVYVVANENQLHAAIARKHSFRKTYLQRRLKDAFTERVDEAEPVSSQRSEDFNSFSGNSSTDTDEFDFDETKSVNVLGTMVDLAGTPGKTPGKRKRQWKLPDECSSPSKMALRTEVESPLGINRFQKMTLKCPVPKQLFQS